MANCNRGGQVYKRHHFTKLEGPKGQRRTVPVDNCTKCGKAKPQ